MAKCIIQIPRGAILCIKKGIFWRVYMWIYFYYQVHPQHMSLPRSQQHEFSVGKHTSEGTQKDLDIT